jgi:hypothetical protein
MTLFVRKRLTVKEILGTAREPKLDADGKPVLENGQPVMVPLAMTQNRDLFVVFGRARESVQGKPTTYGTYIEYHGAFSARRMVDGVEFEAGRIIFPPPTNDVVDNIFTAAKAADSSADVAFAFVIGTETFNRVENDATVVKWRYTCRPIEVSVGSRVDPLADIKAAIARQAPELLPAPPETAAIAAPTPATSSEPEGKNARSKASVAS